MADVNKQLKRIQKELKKQWSDKKLAPCLPEAEVAAFEHRHKIRLPEEYRRFLLEISGDFEILRGDQKRKDVRFWKKAARLNKPFPFTEAWQREEDENGDEIPGDITDKETVQGTLVIHPDGCGICYVLVVNGLSYGQVWVLDYSCDQIIRPFRINPQKRGFLHWYQSYLDDTLWDDPDYQEDID